MKSLLTILSLFFLSLFKAQGGCSGPYLDIYKLSPAYNFIEKLYWTNQSPKHYSLASTDSISVRGYASGCDGKITEIYRNDSLILSPSKPAVSLLRCVAGAYKIKVVSIIIAPQGVYFYFNITNPKDVGISSNDKSSDNIQVYVNSIEEKIQVNSFGDVIKQVSLYTIESKLLETAIFENTSASVPFGNYPKGIYFMKIVLASDKVVIKKVLF